jgi:hypothetical protein
MGLKDTGTVNDAATAGAGRGTGSRGTPITRDPWNTGPVNPNSFFGPGQGSNYVPAKIGAYATPEPPRRNKTELKITLTPDPVSGGGGIEGNFYTRYTDPDGNLMLKGGYVWAGDGSETIVPFELMAAPVGDNDPDWAGTAGQHLVLTVTGTAEAADDVLLPQFNMSAGSLAVASDVGDPTLPTVDSLSGTFKTSLGVFGENSFSPNLPGNYGIGFCFSGFTISRG